MVGFYKMDFMKGNARLVKVDKLNKILTNLQSG